MNASKSFNLPMIVSHVSLIRDIKMQERDGTIRAFKGMRRNVTTAAVPTYA